MLVIIIAAVVIIVGVGLYIKSTKNSNTPVNKTGSQFPTNKEKLK